MSPGLILTLRVAGMALCVIVGIYYFWVRKGQQEKKQN
jgi:hypothetical protein